MHVVIVDFEIDPAHWGAFLPLMQAQATNSLAKEPDCHQFDVCVEPDAPHRVFLYEIYSDAAAFAAHLASDHFKSFDAAVARMVRAKTVRQLTKLAATPVA